MSLIMILVTIAQALLYTLISPWVVGMVNWLEARLQGRRGPSPFQPYYELWKLFHRRAVIPETASWVYSAAPFIFFGCYLVIGLKTPIVYLAMPFDQALAQGNGLPLADFLVIIYLMGLARFAVALAGMDTGSPFGGMGSGREMYLHVLAEPVLIMVAYALALNAYSTSLLSVFSTGAKLGLEYYVNNPSLASIGFSVLALTLIFLAEAGRLPFDHPEGHLELTMVGKAIHMEYGGHFLALLDWAEAMRLTFFIILLLNLLFPGTLLAPGNGWMNGIYLILFPLKFLVAIALLAGWELISGKMRLRGTLNPASLALLLSLLAVLSAVVIRYFIVSGV